MPVCFGMAGVYVLAVPGGPGNHMARTPVESLPIGRTGTEKYSLLLESVQKPAKVKSIWPEGHRSLVFADFIIIFDIIIIIIIVQQHRWRRYRYDSWPNMTVSVDTRNRWQLSTCIVESKLGAPKLGKTQHWTPRATKTLRSLLCSAWRHALAFIDNLKIGGT